MGLGCCCNRCTLTVVLNNYDNTSTVAGYPDTPTPPIEPYPRPGATWNGGSECGAGNQPLCDAWPRDERPGTIGTNWNVYALGTGQTTRTQDVQGHKLIQSRKAFHGRPAFDCISNCGTLVKYKTVERIGRAQGGHYTGPGGSLVIEWDIEVRSTMTVDTSSGCKSQTVSTVIFHTGSGSYDLYDANIEAQLIDKINIFLDTACISSGDAAAKNFDNSSGAFIDVSTFEYTSTSFDYATENNDSGDYYSFVGSCVLSEEYDTIETDIKAASSTWDISNNYYLPWRIDGYRAKAPQSIYDEVTSGVSPDVGILPDSATTIDYTEACEQTGTIVGEPFAGGWPEWSFGFDHEVWRNLTTSPVIAYYGAFTDGTIIPHTATYWSTEYFAGAAESWPGYGYWFDENEEVLHVQKGQEAKPLLPSYNNFEPCGITRWLPNSGVYTDPDEASENTSWTVTGFDGADPTFEGDITSDLTAGMLLVFNKGPNDGEIYYIASFSYDGGGDVTTVVLGAQLVTDGTEWAALIARVQAAHTARKWTIGQGDYGRASLLRFQYDRSGTQWPASRAIVGRVAVTTSYDSGSGLTTFTTASATELITGDKVDILDSANAAIGGASNLSVTWVSNTSFTVSGDKTASAAFAKSSGAPYYGWNDDASYGDFVILTTQSSVVSGVYTLTSTLTDDSKTGDCAILACTPDGDEPAGSKAISFPSVPSFTICGGRNWKQLITYCVNPIWQDPVSTVDPFTGCPEYVEPRTVLRTGTRGGESCPALPAKCVYPISDVPVEGAGYDASAALPASGAWMSGCLYP